MKNELDSLGRFVIPVKYRRKMNIQAGDELDIRLQKDTLMIKKAYPSCIFCETENDLISLEEKMICCDCLKRINKITL